MESFDRPDKAHKARKPDKPAGQENTSFLFPANLANLAHLANLTLLANLAKLCNLAKSKQNHA